MLWWGSCQLSETTDSSRLTCELTTMTTYCRWLTDWVVGLRPTHTHTSLTALCPGLPGWAGTRKVKPIWILLQQETVSGSGISWAIYTSAPRSRQITMPAPHHSVFYRPDALPAAQPTVSKHWRQNFTSQSTQNRSFRRRFPKPISWLSMEKLSLTQHLPIKRNALQHKMNTKKLKPGLVTFYNIRPENRVGLYTGWSDVTVFMATIPSPFCGNSIWHNVWR